MIAVMSRAADVRNLLVGALIGIVAILPGASGGVVAVVFEVYERIIDGLADIFNKLRSDFRFFFFIGSGILLGAVVMVFGLDWLMANYKVPAMFLFMGLIIGQFPEVYKMAQEDGEKANGWNCLILVLGISFTVILAYIGKGDGSAGAFVFERDIVTVIFLLMAGSVMAFSTVAPGISGTAVLIIMGIFQALLAAFTSFDMFVILVFGVGFVIGVVVFAKIISWSLSVYRKSTYFMILGLTLGSTVFVILFTLTGISTIWDIVYGIIAMALGLLLSCCFSKLNAKHPAEPETGKDK